VLTCAVLPARPRPAAACHRSGNGDAVRPRPSTRTASLIRKEKCTTSTYLMKRLYADGTRCLFSGAAENQSKGHVLVPYFDERLICLFGAPQHRAPACHCCSFQVETCETGGARHLLFVNSPTVKKGSREKDGLFLSLYFSCGRTVESVQWCRWWVLHFVAAS
jgi:hypothetical protein